MNTNTKTNTGVKGTRFPPAARTWRFESCYGYEQTSPLWLYWEVSGDPISDDYLPDKISAVELWALWRRTYPHDDPGPYGRGMAPIDWFVEGDGVLECAPFQDPRGLHGYTRDFLTDFTWPSHPDTGRPLRWTELPVVDKVWRRTRRPLWAPTKGGFIQEATGGWKPGALQPFMDIRQIERAARLGGEDQ
jgi:hypothetical protein